MNDKRTQGVDDRAMEQIKKRLRVMKDRVKKGGDVFSRQISQWVESVAEYTWELVRRGKETPSASITVFWIRLYGLLTDIVQAVRSQQEFLEGIKTSPHEEVRQLQQNEFQGYDRLMRAFVNVVDTVRDCFNEEELVYLQYRRHVEAHPFQEGYKLNLKKNGNVKEKLMNKILQKEMAIEEVDEILGRVIRCFGGRDKRDSEEDIALDFAKRIEPHLNRMLEASRHYCGKSSFRRDHSVRAPHPLVLVDNRNSVDTMEQRVLSTRGRSSMTNCYKVQGVSKDGKKMTFSIISDLDTPTELLRYLRDCLSGDLK